MDIEEGNEKIWLKIAKAFLIIAVIGTIQLALVNFFIIMEQFTGYKFPYNNTVKTIFGLIYGIIFIWILRNGLEDIGLDCKVNLTYYRYEKYLMVGYVASNVILLPYDFVIPILESLGESIQYLILSYVIVIIVFRAVAIVAIVMLALYIYKIGRPNKQYELIIGGILLLIYPLVGIGGILIFIGLKKLLIKVLV
ncbi:MAG: hypothetical protein ACTSRP_04575 [Candidatus Helarchaeota archaeon]